MLLIAVLGSVLLAGLASLERPAGPAQASEGERPAPVVVGDLGGAPVAIPASVAHLVEYEGDPGWGPRQPGPPPVRTKASRLMSFGMRFKWPDMSTLPEDAFRVDQKQYRRGTSPWLDLTLLSASAYPGDGFVDHVAKTLLERSAAAREQSGTYKPVPSDDPDTERYDLELSASQTRWRYPPDHEELYFVRNAQGQRIAYIRCRHPRGDGGYTTCEQRFTLAPDMKVQVQVRYSKEFLAEHRAIQEAIAARIRSYRQPQ